LAPPSELSPISEASAANAAVHAKATKERVERIERGETVKGGLGKPLTRKEAEAIMMQAGMTRASSASPWFGFPAMSPRYLASCDDPFCGELEARLAESARRRSPYFGARSLPLRFLAMNAIRMRWEMLCACIF